MRRPAFLATFVLLALASAVDAPRAGGATGVPARAPAQDAGFRVVVNAANPAASLGRAELARIFLRKTQLWPDGSPAVPVDLPDGAAPRAAFSTQVVGKSVGAVKGYWQQQVFTGRGVPPLVKASEAEALAFVAATPGAVAYVSAGATLPASVKALKVEN